MLSFARFYCITIEFYETNILELISGVLFFFFFMITRKLGVFIPLTQPLSATMTVLLTVLCELLFAMCANFQAGASPFSQTLSALAVAPTQRYPN